MKGLMQDTPLRVSRIIDHAAKYHAGREIVTRTIEGPVETTTWSAVRTRAMKVRQALARLGIARGDVVGAMAWNTSRHLEVWYGAPGAGAALHTLNPRLFTDQLVYVANHAEDRVIFVDLDLVPLIERVWERLKTVTDVIVMTDRAHMPETALPRVHCYEELLAAEDGAGDWADGDETDACGICYTSGTTGDPKGVVYSHRSNTLHALTVAQPDMLALSSTDRLMPVVPLFHANGWSTAFSAPLVGASMVMPGRDMSPAGLHDMLERGVTVTAAVPTVWLALLQHMKAQGLRLSTLNRVVIGGSSCPRAVIEAFQNDYGVRVLHAWGMTEMSPLGTVCTLKPEALEGDADARMRFQLTTGHPPFGVDLKIVDDEGREQPRDGVAQGRLMARGDAVLRRYLKANAEAADAEGWFDTGDVATLDPHGYMAVTDRSKDVIKSGGEWISSIELENAAVAHPGVAEAAAIGVAHPKWGERPVLVVVRATGAAPEKAELIELVGRSVARWQAPDDVIFMDEIPHTATGKISKLSLRARLGELGYRHPEA